MTTININSGGKEGKSGTSKILVGLVLLLTVVCGYLYYEVYSMKENVDLLNRSVLALLKAE